VEWRAALAGFAETRGAGRIHAAAMRACELDALMQRFPDVES